jgi:hypothetical protein
VSRKHGHRHKRRTRNPDLPAGWAKPRKALMALLAAQGVTEADWRRIQKARALVNRVNDELAARGSGVVYVVMQAAVRPYLGGGED